MLTEQLNLITSFLSPVDHSLDKYKFIGFDGNLCAANAKALGILNDSALLGDQAPIAVSGIALVLSGGVITPGSAVVSDAAGKAVVATSFSASTPAGAVAVTSSGAQPAMTLAGSVLPQAINGYSLDSAAAPDVLIRIKLV